MSSSSHRALISALLEDDAIDDVLLNVYGGEGVVGPAPDLSKLRKLTLNNAGVAKKRRKIGPNTYIHLDADGTMRVQFWATDIITVNPEGDVTVNCAGYIKKRTTRQRLNKYLPPGWSVYQHQNVAYWHWDGRPYHTTVEYMDGDMISRYGRLHSHEEPRMHPRRKRLDSMTP